MTLARRSSYIPFARPRVRLLPLVYLVVGAIVASTHHYFQNVNGWRGVLSALLAIFLWPLVLLGTDLHIH